MSSTVEANVDVNSSALSFLQVFSLKLYELPSIDPDFYQSIEIVSGTWGTVGFVVLAHYSLDGNAYVVKAEAEAIDLTNISITFNALEGDILDEFKIFKVIIKVTPNLLSGSVVNWTLQFEKLNDHISEPTSLLNAFVQLTKNIDDVISNLL